VGRANGDSEIVKMWKDYFKGILNSESSANESAESVDHSHRHTGRDFVGGAEKICPENNNLP